MVYTLVDLPFADLLLAVSGERVVEDVIVFAFALLEVFDDGE